jgi:L,D-transpeptidase catalytic domain
MPLLLTALVVAVTVGTANAVGFEIRAFGLAQRWQADKAAGVPADQLAAARSQVAAERMRRVGPLPYPVVSGAALSDPFRQAETTSDDVYNSALHTARGRAKAALARLRDASGPNAGASIDRRLVQLTRSRRPIDFEILAHRWNSEAAAQEQVRQRLGTASGGLSDGLPTDVVTAAAALTQLADRAGMAGIATQDAAEALALTQLYLTEQYPMLLARHQAVLTELQAAAGALRHRLDLRARADEELGKLPELLEQADQYGAGSDFKDRADQVKAGIATARAERDGARLDTTVADLESLIYDLQTAGQGGLPTARIPCRTDAPDQLIVIHLATQQLVAYDRGCPFLRTPVTTGQPALPTSHGTFRIFYKAPVYHMISPWPRGSPFYYDPAWVTNAMEFIGNGTFLHSAAWQPAGTYGPGSQYGPYASHGCIHVLDVPLQQLYDWAKIGATVAVED